jgi:crossover junction endodeoxyribonuclease RuvC
VSVLSVSGQVPENQPEKAVWQKRNVIMEYVTVGLDLSLCSSGFSMKDGQNIHMETIKTVPKDFPNDLARLIHIRNAIMGKIPKNVRMICIEDFFTGLHPGSGIGLAMLGATVRLALYEAGYPMVIVSPTQVKKFVTGKGAGEKSLILREVYRRYGLECKNDNESDAATLMFLAESLITGWNNDTPKFQVEVISTVRKERPRYNVSESWAMEIS